MRCVCVRVQKRKSQHEWGVPIYISICLNERIDGSGRVVLRGIHFGEVKDVPVKTYFERK